MAVREVWYDADLLASDEDDLTDLYAQIFKARPDRDQRFVADQLRRFHIFARQHFALAEPQWDELPVPPRRTLVAPGYIREDHYLRALNALASAKLDADERVAARSILLLCYRFGLRAAEAFALQRADWVEHGTETYLLVGNNRQRKLKRTASRRIVPLLFRLTAQERAIINAMLRTAEADAGDDAGAFIHGASWLNRSKRRKVHSEIIRALRRGTRSATTTLHHGRHSFAMRVLEALLASNPDYSNVLPDPSPASIAEQLLGHPHQTRRGLWALARALGHAGLETSITSYIHLLDGWADRVADEVVRKRLRRPALACENLDLLPRAKRAPEPEGPPPPRQPSCADAIRLLRLAARNTPPEAVALYLGLDEARCSELCLAAASIDKSGSAHSLFHLVTENQWAGLLECAKRLEDATGPNRTPLRGRPTPAAAAVLVGRQRQLLMAVPDHFAWVRSFIDDCEIPPHLYAVTATDLNHPVLREQAELSGFALTRRADLSATGTQQQIDALSLDGGFSLVRHRCALVFRENAEFAIRNRIGLVLLLLAWAVSGHQPK